MACARDRYSHPGGSCFNSEAPACESPSSCSSSGMYPPVSDSGSSISDKRNTMAGIMNRD